MSGVVTVRPFSLEDLPAAAGFCDRARQQDPGIEPFAQRLALLATGPRARLELWQLAEEESGAVQGLAFVALREARSAEGAGCAMLDAYAAVAPALRRQGLGRALCEPALQWVTQAGGPAALRARVRDDAQAGRRFLAALGFAEVSAQLALSWTARPIEAQAMPALRVRRVPAGDAQALRDLTRLAAEAWAGEPDSFATRSDEIAQLLSESDRLVLLAEADRRGVGYLSGVWLGRTLGIEEVAVVPGHRRAGIGRALVAAALQGAAHAALTVAESNRAGRALYRSLGFAQSSRRLVYELRCG